MDGQELTDLTGSDYRGHDAKKVKFFVMFFYFIFYFSFFYRL